jgi:hypothetical protein
MGQVTAGNGPEVARLVSAATTNATVAKATPGRLFGWVASNTNAAVRYLKIYDTAAAPAVGTTVPRLTILLPVGNSAAHDLADGIVFSSGISFALTSGAADADTGAVGAAESIVQLFYR